jgi:alkylhydroperoxidase/carboxymuconolactone decarboxylase family protein YurZ
MTTTRENVDEQQELIRARYEVNGDAWSPELNPLLEHPEIAAAYVQFAQVAAASGALEPKLRELILLAVNGSTTTLHVPAMERSMRAALRHGASREELVEVIELISVLGIHSAHTGLPLLHEVLKEQGLLATEELDEQQADIKSRYIAGRGMWGDALEAMLLLDPALVDAYLDFSSVAWKDGGVLPPVVKELIYVAIDASVTHLYHGGTRSHIERALEAGATRKQIAAVLALISTIGAHSLTSGLNMLNELTS